MPSLSAASSGASKAFPNCRTNFRQRRFARTFQEIIFQHHAGILNARQLIPRNLGGAVVHKVGIFLFGCRGIAGFSSNYLYWPATVTTCTGTGCKFSGKSASVITTPARFGIPPLPLAARLLRRAERQPGLYPAPRRLQQRSVPPWFRVWVVPQLASGSQ